MVYSVEKLNSLVSAARVDLEAFKARERHHKKSRFSFRASFYSDNAKNDEWVAVSESEDSHDVERRIRRTNF